MNQTIQTYLRKLSGLAPRSIYLVGGTVRDLLIGGKTLKDIDLAMPAGAELVARQFADAIEGSFFYLDEERKITRVVKHLDQDLMQFDFTNFDGSDLTTDLERRDFTINAVAYDLRSYLKADADKGLIDPCRGREDIKRGLIRVNSPAVLDADPLRLLRAVRFAATLGFAIEEGTAVHIRGRARRIAEPSPERLREELFLILSEPGATDHLLLLDSLGLLAVLFPELEPLRGFAPGRYHVHDVLTHSLKTAGYVDRIIERLPEVTPVHAAAVHDHLHERLERGVSRIAALRFACLLHDTAKPETFTDRDGHIRFHGHDNIGAEKALFSCRRFRLSRSAESLVSRVIKFHMRLFNLSSPGGPSKNAMYRYCRDLGDALPESLLLSQADALATYEIMPREKFTDTEKPMAAVLDYYYSKFLKADEKPLVNGSDLIRQGLQPGPRFREILEAVKERQAAGELNSRQEALAYLTRLK
jgi:tRNA nucleotidyltransferase/poly(A) polymerase